MKVILEQDEIEAALRAYVHNDMGIPQDRDISIDLRAGRGENGYTATLDIQAARKTSTASIGQVIAAPVKRAADPVVRNEDPVAQNISSGNDERVDPVEVDEPEAEETSRAQSLLDDVSNPTETKRSIFNAKK